MNNQIEYRFNQKSFNKKREIKYLSLFTLILSLCGLCIFFVMCISDLGFDNLIWFINKNTIIGIVITSICLGCSSFIVQSISGNRMADTSILGIGSVNLLALTFMVSFLEIGVDESSNIFNYSLPFVFILCSTLSCIVIYFLSKKEKFKLGRKFILAGILLNFVFTAFAASINSLLKSAKQQIISGYISGKVEQVNELYLFIGIVILVITIFWMFTILKKFQIISVNVYIASQLGINVRHIYFQGLIIAGILTGVAFLISGNLVFLGLVGANIAYSIFKKNYRYTFPTSGLISFIILSLTFFINRNLLTNTNINTSSLIPLIASPYFIYLIIKKG